MVFVVCTLSFFCVDCWVAHLDVTNTHTFWKKRKSWLWMQHNATMRSTGDTCSQDIQECFNLQKRLFRLLQTIKHNPKQKNGETMGRHMLAKLCSSTAVDDESMPTMPNSTICWTSAARWNHSSSYDLTGLLQKTKDTILSMIVDTRPTCPLLLTLRPFMVSPPSNVKYLECSGPQKDTHDVI